MLDLFRRYLRNLQKLCYRFFWQNCFLSCLFIVLFIYYLATNSPIGSAFLNNYLPFLYKQQQGTEETYSVDFPSPVSDQLICNGELMAMPYFLNGKHLGFGKRFDCELLQHLSKLKLLKNQMDISVKPKSFQNSDVVFLTYSSTNHFTESRAAINKLRTSGIENKIIFYDLGLQSDQKAELQSVCNLELRKFNFSSYPSFVIRLMKYHFKPLAIAEVFKDYDAIWVMDTSVRFLNKSNLLHFYDRVRSGAVEPFVIRRPSSHGIFATTKEGMYDYLPIDKDIAKNRSMFDANSMFIVKSAFSRDAVKWNALCALTKDCMDPSGSTLYCRFKKERYSEFAKCHRYDQSSINIILTSLKEQQRMPYIGYFIPNISDSFDPFLNVRREDRLKANKLNLPCK